MNVSQQLRRTSLCAQLNETELAALEQIVSIRSVARNEILFFQGDKAEGFFVLLSGRVRVYKASPEGKEFTLHIISPGQMFAEAAIFQAEHYPANCAALEKSTVAFFPKKQFIRLVKESPDISLKMISGLSIFVRDFARTIEDLSLKEVSARLASYILTEFRRRQTNSFELEFTKTELARKLGTISATLSRNLKKLKEMGAIEVKGRRITVIDSDHLESVADGEKI